MDDAESEWVFDKNHFDYIHLRTMAGSIYDWPLLLSRCFESLPPLPPSPPPLFSTKKLTPPL